MNRATFTKIAAGVGLLAVLLLSAGSAHAGVAVGLSINIGAQPVWGPVGYDHADFYYFPDIGVYYNVVNHRYIYFDRGRWVHVAALPPRYRGFDLYGSYKAVINEPRPWLRDNVYRAKFASFKGRHDQIVIRDSKDPRYYAVPGHPMHDQWAKDHPDHERGRH
jgi:hypothetical protein